MKEMIVKLVLIPLITQLVNEMLTKEKYEIYGDKLFDFFEELVADSETTWDDSLVLPVIAQARVLLNIPDLPDKE